MKRDAPEFPLPVLQVFARAPVVGSVKTRLARSIGAEHATAVHVALVDLTLAVARTAHRHGTIAAIELWCDADCGHAAFAHWAAESGASLHVQQGATLGERMQHALGMALARGRSGVLIGSDCPVLLPRHLDEAAAALHDHDAVLGPVEDGGYVLVGLSRPVSCFDGVAWGTSGVMEATRRNLRRVGASWAELEVLWDVDEAADLERWRAHTSSARKRAASVE